MSDYNVNPYTPQNVTPLRFFVQAVLPLVYDDSLSYYEVLSKIAHKLNEVITSLDQNNIQVTEITNAYNAFVEYIISRQDTFENDVTQNFTTLSNTLLSNIEAWETTTQQTLQNQYDAFLSEYQRTFGVSQYIGDSTTDVMSQNAIRTYTILSMGHAEEGDNIDTIENNTVYSFEYLQVISGDYGTFPPNCGTCTVMTIASPKSLQAGITQILSDYANGVIWIRQKKTVDNSYVWDSWFRSITLDDVKNLCVVRVGSLTSNANVDAQETNTICTYPSEMVSSGINGTFPDGVTTTCTVTTFSHLKGDAVPAVQMCYVYNTNTVYYRFRSYNGSIYLWSDWFVTLKNADITNKCVTRIPQAEAVDNIDTQAPNTIIAYPTALIQSGQNGTFPPDVETTCTAVTFSNLSSQSAPIIQYCCNYRNSNLWYRLKSYNGSAFVWSDWFCIQSNPLPAVQNCYTDTVQNLRCTTTDIRGKKIYTLYLDFGADRFSGFEFGNASGAEGFVIKVDETNVYYYGHTSTDFSGHDLDIQNFVSLSIVANDDDTADCTLITNGGAYSWTIDNWNDNSTEVSLLSTALTINDFKISVTPISSNRPVIIFGDSYLADWNTRWGYYLLHSKLDNYGVSAYSGKNSMAAYNSFNALLNFNIPKCVIWAMGMNDPDHGAVNADWQAYYNNVKAKCEKYGIKLILCTIPNGTNHDNTYKNAIIRNTSDYIDLASAVQDDQGNWYTNMQDVDGVHTTALGAKAIFNKFLSGYPYTI